MSKRSPKPTSGKETPSPTNGSQSLWAMFAIPIVLIASYHVFFGSSNDAQAQDHSAGAAKGIVVVDSKAIFKTYVDEQTRRFSAGEAFTEAQLQNGGAEFATEFLRAVNKYRNAGYIVFDRDKALGIPKGSDITEEIADALGVNVELARDPFEAPILKPTAN